MTKANSKVINLSPADIGAATSAQGAKADTAMQPGTAVTASQFTLKDGSDATKIAAFSTSGITTATTRTYAWPDASGTVALQGGTLTMDSGLDTAPTLHWLDVDTGFYEHAVGSIGYTSNGARVMILTSTGVLAGERTSGSSSATGVGFQLSTTAPFASLFSSGTASTQHIRFFNNASVTPAQVGNISTNASATAYNTSSDKTLKDDDGLLSFDDAKAILRLIEIHRYRWKDTGEEDIGAFAQDLFQVYPKAVTPGYWYNEKTGETAEEGTEGAKYSPWSVDYSKLVPLLTVGIIGLLEQQDDILSRLSALEA